MRKAINVGFIGYGSQSLRIYDILKKNYTNINVVFYNYKKKKLKFNSTQNIEDLYMCDLIIICAPNNYHFQYLKKFINKKYIFCEKPPVSNLRQIEYLKKYDKGKIFYNYNMRFSKVYDFIVFCKKFKLGKFLDGDIVFSHLLGTQKKYQKNWRSNKSLSKKGVFEVVSIHALDLVSSLFKNVKVKNNLLSSKSLYGDSYDNAFTVLEVEKKSYIKIFTSYIAPYNYKIYLTFENAIIEVTDKLLSFYYPGKVLDHKGFSVKPKIFKQKKYNRSKDFKASLVNSVNFFIQTYSKRKLFCKKEKVKALNSNKLIL